MCLSLAILLVGPWCPRWDHAKSCQVQQATGVDPFPVHFCLSMEAVESAREAGKSQNSIRD